jgi:hypothetical protein
MISSVLRDIQLTAVGPLTYDAYQIVNYIVNKRL